MDAEGEERPDRVGERHDLTAYGEKRPDRVGEHHAVTVRKTRFGSAALDSTELESVIFCNCSTFAVQTEPSRSRGLHFHDMWGYSSTEPLHLGDRPGT